MRLCDVADKRQPQPGALGVVHQRVATTVELLENLLLFGGRDSDPAILDLQLDAAVRAIEADADVLLLF